MITIIVLLGSTIFTIAMLRMVWESYRDREFFFTGFFLVCIIGLGLCIYQGLRHEPEFNKILQGISAEQLSK